MRQNLSNLICVFNNALILKKQLVVVPFNHSNLRLVTFLYQENYLDSFKICVHEKSIFVKFRFLNHRPVMKSILLANKKGQQKTLKVSVFWKSSSLNLGQFIYSTPEGLISDTTAKKTFTGGHLFCYISLT